MASSERPAPAAFVTGAAGFIGGYAVAEFLEQGWRVCGLVHRTASPRLDALAESGRVALVAFPLGQGYYNQGFWIYRQAFRKALSEVLPIPLIQSDAHLSTELSLTHQAAKAGRKERYMVHIVNYSPVRKTPKHTDFYDDPVPLSNVAVRLNLPLKVSTAKTLYGGRRLPVQRNRSGGVEVVIPQVGIHEVVCFELS